VDLTGDLLRGHTDAILLSILQTQDSYGYEINQRIFKQSNQLFSLTEATLYTSFKRLEKDGYIVSYWKDGINQVPRKYYSITVLGQDYLKKHIDSFHKATAVIQTFLGGKDGKED
jgi:PadR family transcriptional regulator PadR